MRTVTYGAACSLDGFIAAADGGIDWLYFSSDVHDFMANFWPTVDTVVMGRKTWDASIAMAGGANEPGSAQDGGAEAVRPQATSGTTGEAKGTGGESAGSDGAGDSGLPSDLQTYVFSRTLEQIVQPGVHLVKDNGADFVRDLKRKPGRGICVMGGGEFARSLLEAGVIDEVGLNVHPILLGSGVPLFLDTGRRIQLALAESRTIAGGCVLSTYRVVRPDHTDH
ncbi:MAG: dihydrofolate reductase [Anaerolineae bacterium]|nr:dihydrofolate reductase [Gemmatimonadaceae bacterium]